MMSRNDANWIICTHDGRPVAYFMFAIDASMFLAYMPAGSSIHYSSTSGEPLYILTPEARELLNGMKYAYDSKEWFVATANRILATRADHIAKREQDILTEMRKRIGR